MVILTVFTISRVMADDTAPKTVDPKKIQKQESTENQKSSALDNKIDNMILQQKQHHKSILDLDKGFNQQTSLQKQFQSDLTRQFNTIQKKMDDQMSKLNDRTENNQAFFKSEIIKIENQLQVLQAELVSSVSTATQNFNSTLQTYRIDHENQINEIRTLITDMQTVLMSDQSNRYSAIEESRITLQTKMDTIAAQVGQFQKQLSQDQPDVQQIINDQITAQQDRLNAIETNIKNQISNSNAQLNSDINDTIRQLKTDFSRFKQEIDDTMSKVSSQVLEIKHEQQIELQSLVKQLTKELNRHDQNMSDSLIKAEQSLDTNHLTWIIYGLLCLIIGLIVFIVWDRNSTVAPLIARIRKLEDNLVIEY